MPPMRNVGDLLPRKWKEIIDQDVNGFFNLAHATLPHLIDGARR